jgi:hypothetical protein
LTAWRQGKSKAIKNILGRDIRARPRTDGEPGYEFWRSDIDRIKRTAIPLAPFKEWDPVAKRDVTWLPTRDVVSNYSWHRRIDKWVRREECPFLENGRLPATRQKIVLALDNVGLQEVTFYLKEDLDEIDTNVRRAKNPADGLKAMTKLVENGSVSRWRVFKSPRSKKLRLDKRGRPQEMVVLSADQIAAHKIPSELPCRDVQGRELITPKEVEELTEQAFLITTMLYWEKHPNPYSHECLEIVYHNRLVSYEDKKTAQTVWYIQKQAKHYVKKTILEAYDAYKSFKQAPRGRKSSKGIVEPASGGVYMTALAANREHGANKQALDAWREKGWLDWIEVDRTGPGPYKKAVCYREDGERGFVFLQSLQAGRSRNIPPSVAAKLTAAAADRGIPMKSAASASEGLAKEAREPLEAKRPNWDVNVINPLEIAEPIVNALKQLQRNNETSEELARLKDIPSQNKVAQQLAPSQARRKQAADRDAYIDAIFVGTKEDPLKVTEKRWSEIHDAIQKDETNRHLLYRNKHSGTFITVASMKEHYLDYYRATREEEN